MCRLLAWVSRAPATMEEMVGRQDLAGFTALARIHRDGWGMAWGSGEDSGADRPDVAHSMLCAAEDPGFARATRSARGDAGIVHLRWATPGMAVTVPNCHPFARGDLAMSHNGGIYPLDRIGEILPAEWEATVQGTTDSERYVLAVVAGRQDSGKPVADVIVEVVGRLFSEWSPSSLNAICLTPDAVLAVSAWDPRVPAPALPESADEYYALRYQVTAGGVVVSSSGYPQPRSQGWRRLENMTMLEIRRNSVDLAVRALPFDPSAGAGAVTRVTDVR